MEAAVDTTIGAGDFKAKCLRLIDDVGTKRQTLLITKRGRPVARLVPVAPQTALFGAMAGSVHEEADIVSPLGEDWDAAK